MIDCGGETPVSSESPAFQLPPAVALAVHQRVDDVAWSHSGGKEYVRSSEQEISNTDGFNPDAITRLAFYPENPMRGHRFNNAGEVVPTRMADEEWVYGEVPVITGLVYDNSIDGEGFRQVKGPTDQNGPMFDGSCNPDDPSTDCPSAPEGALLFQDINLAGFRLTPGRLNDHDASGSGGANIAQFRFTPGDFNFDGVADTEDYRLICAGVGADLDAVAPWICPDGETVIDNYVFQGREFQRVHAMQQMAPSDGDAGANATIITAADATAHRVMLGFGVAPDQNGDGVVNATDLALILGSWGTDDPIADVDCNGAVNAADLALVLGAWGG